MTSPIIDLLLTQADAHRASHAIIDGARVVSYAELERLSRQWAARFEERGVGAGDCVLVFVPPSIDLYAILLGLWWRGAVAVFTDAWTTRNRMAHVCAQTQPKVMVTIAKGALLRLITPALRGIPVEMVWPVKRLPPAGNAPAPAELGADHSALVTFTTGSSGLPKGADRTHGFLLAQHHALSRALGDIPQGPDLVTLPIFGLHALAAGRTCLLAPIPHRKPSDYDPTRLLDCIRRHGPTSAAASPAVFDTLVRYLERTGVVLDQPLNLHVGGAAVTPELVSRMRQVFPAARLTAVYGSTEAEPIALLDGDELAARRQDPGQGLPAGRPYAGIRLQIVPVQRGPIGDCSPRAWQEMALPAGEIGEICVAGDHVLTRYFNNDAAIRRQKVRVGSCIWHRTGDAGSLACDGTLNLYGTISQSFDWDGRDWYPFPIELELDALTGVAKAAVICGRTGPVVCIEPNGRQTPAALEQNIERLSLPFRFSLWLGRLPRDPRHNSKIDLHRLKDLAGVNS